MIRGYFGGGGILEEDNIMIGVYYKIIIDGTGVEGEVRVKLSDYKVSISSKNEKIEWSTLMQEDL